MSNVSSIQKLKFYFTQLNNYFNFIDLNGVSSKSYYSGWELKETKGVLSDFIRIYTINSTNSFAFAFDNPKESEETSITVTYKKDNEIKSSKVFRFDEFKTKFKEFLNVLDILKSSSKNISSKSVESSVIKIFDFKSQASAQEDLFKDFESQLDSLNFNCIESFGDTSSLIPKHTKKIKKIEDDLKLYSTMRSEELGIPELESKLKSLRKTVKDEVGFLSNNKKLPSLKEKLASLKSSHRESLSFFNVHIQKIIKTFPASIRNKLKSISDDSIKEKREI